MTKKLLLGLFYVAYTNLTLTATPESLQSSSKQPSSSYKQTASFSIHKHPLLQSLLPGTMGLTTGAVTYWLVELMLNAIAPENCYPENATGLTPSQLLAGTSALCVAQSTYKKFSMGPVHTIDIVSDCNVVDLVYKNKVVALYFSDKGYSTLNDTQRSSITEQTTVPPTGRKVRGLHYRLQDGILFLSDTNSKEDTEKIVQRNVSAFNVTEDTKVLFTADEEKVYRWEQQPSPKLQKILNLNNRD